MSSNAHSHGSDKGAAFAGLIGGAIFIAIVVMALVVWTNKRFDAHEGEAAHSARTGPAAAVVG
jgi:hypothetical protein